MSEPAASSSPSAIRRAPRAGDAWEAGQIGGAQQGACACFELAYQPPLAWERLLGFLELRAIPGVEAVVDGAYVRSVRLQPAAGGPEALGWVSVRPDEERACAVVTASPSLEGELAQVAMRLRHQLDLDCDPAAVAVGLEGFRRRFPDAYLPGTRLPGCFDAFEMCVRAILGQQISVKGASTLAGRVASALGAPLDDAPAGIACAFPSAQDICALGDGAQDALGALGIVGTRTRTIAHLARGLVEGSLDLAYGADPAQLVPALQAIPGIGPWTAQYLSMRATGNPDAFPSTDLGVKKALGSLPQREVEAVAEGWRPWRSYATICLWSS